MKSILIIICGALCLAATSCGTTGRAKFPAMPPEPEWQGYSRPPIIEQLGADYRVSNEYVLKSVQEHKYLEHIKDWKIKNSIP